MYDHECNSSWLVFVLLFMTSLTCQLWYMFCLKFPKSFENYVLLTQSKVFKITSALKNQSKFECWAIRKLYFEFLFVSSVFFCILLHVKISFLITLDIFVNWKRIVHPNVLHVYGTTISWWVVEWGYVQFVHGICTHCLDLDLNDQKNRRYFWQWFHIWKNKWKITKMALCNLSYAWNLKFFWSNDFIWSD